MHYRLSVSILIRRRDQILVVSSRKWGGFSLPGGKVDPGETFEQAARRECLEETGCSLVSLSCLGAVEHAPVDADPNRNLWLCMCYVGTIGDQEPKQNEEGTVPRWVEPRAVANESIYRDFNREFLDRAEVAWREPIKLIVLTEGSLHEVVEFESYEQRAWYGYGVGSGARAYGSGQVDTIDYEDLDDLESFYNQVGGEDNCYGITIEDIRMRVGWTPSNAEE